MLTMGRDFLQSIVQCIYALVLLALLSVLFVYLAYGLLVAIWQLSAVSAIVFLFQVVVLFVKEGPNLNLLLAAGLNTIVDAAFGIAIQQYTANLVIGSVGSLLAGLAGLAVIYTLRENIKGSIRRSIS